MIHGLAAGSLVLVLVSALSWAGFDLLRKLLAREIGPLPLMALLCLASVPPFALWAMVDGGFSVGPGYWLPAIGSVALNVVANLLFLEALRTGELSMAVPLLSLTPAFAALVAIPLLGERPSLRGACGIGLVVVGALVLQAPVGGGRGGLGSLRSLRAQRGFWLMAGTALLWSLTIPLDKLAVSRSHPPLHALLLNLGVAVAALALLAHRRELARLAEVRRSPGLFLAALAVSAVALGAQLAALVTVWVSVVETLKRMVGNVFAVVVGRLAFGEAITARKLIAVGLMAGGVALILLL